MTLAGKIFQAGIELIEALSPILVAIISVGGVYIFKSRKEIKVLKRKVNDLSYGVVMDLMMLNDITHIVNNMFTNSIADRFVILTANNGKYKLRAANAIYEQHNTSNGVKTYLSLGVTERYKDFEFDEQYMNMLKQIEADLKPVFIKTADLPPCDLKGIYLSEKIIESLVFFISRETIDNENDRLFYCSVATHNEEGFTQAHKTIIKAYVDQIKFKLKNER